MCRHAASERHVRIHAQEQQRTRNHQGDDAGGDPGDRSHYDLERLQSKDGAKEDAHANRAGGGAARGDVQAQEEHAHSQNQGEDGADGDVAAPTSASERSDRQRDRDAAAEHADEKVQPRKQSAQAAGERDMAERVGREHLVAQDDEVAHQAGGQRDAAARKERVAHEVERQHLLHQLGVANDGSRNRSFPPRTAAAPFAARIST